MSILDVLSGNYIGIVKKYIEKIFQNEAILFNHSEEDFDIILRKVSGNMRIFVYSRRTNRLLRELTDKEAEKILTS